MRYTITIDTDNAAFDDPGEFARILRTLARRCEEGPITGSILDVNGNRVGEITSNQTIKP